VLALPSDDRLTPGERFALELLVDLSAVLRCEGEGDVVRARVVGESLPESSSALRARNWGLDPVDGEVRIDRSVLRLVLDVAGAEVEQRSLVVDRFGRVPSSETGAVRASVDREPVVSLVARTLATAVRDAAGRRLLRFVDPWPDGRRWAVSFTHDLDVVEWWPAFTALRLIELLRHGEITRAARVAAAAVGSTGRPVVWRAITELLATEQRHAVRSTWFVLCDRPTLATARAGDLTYRPDSAQARRIFQALRTAGHEIGLHGSFATSDDHERFGAQRSLVRSLTGAQPAGVRQHYLRMRAATTPRGMAAAGFEYDSTYGFADRNGFRLGTADVLPLWDAERQQPVGLDEAPFIWMDRALSKYQRVEMPRAWIDDALALADQCRSVDGLWVGIWHPNLAPALGFPDAPDAYAQLVGELARGDAHVAPLGELVAWRRARRSLRVRLAPGGDSVMLIADASAQRTTFTIRDAEGRVDHVAQAR
jgi:peptidoglycan/xylan/chitin deacetylase (PgdA/CDA1 family)